MYSALPGEGYDLAGGIHPAQSLRGKWNPLRTPTHNNPRLLWGLPLWGEREGGGRGREGVGDRRASSFVCFSVCGIPRNFAFDIISVGVAHLHVEKQYLVFTEFAFYDSRDL